MSVKEIKEAMEKKTIRFGIRQALKGAKKKGKNKQKIVFISKDTRDSTVKKLESAGIEFTVLKSKEELAKELNLDFESEVFSLASSTLIASKKN
tara:strand:- start:1590 stop:1871 length:282 start_codon:yes stop_codon:yes gene_type:complete